jgi:S-disulfanyl-L-cysteine oxidoreductase SoxD
LIDLPMDIPMVRNKMRAMLILASLLTVCCAITAPEEAQAQTTQSVWDGVYTDAQADRGSGQYTQHCAMCHGAVLEGNGEAPPLVGQFIPDWAGTTLADLFDKISVTMPLNAPGTLRPTIAADILAYILKANNFPAGANALGSTPDSLKTISFDVSKPKPVAAATTKAKHK